MSIINNVFTKMRFVIVAMFVALFSSGAFAACADNEIDVLGDGTQCQAAKFSVTTTSDATSLVWTMTAKGTFYADCGDGGTLSQNITYYGTISGKKITRTGTSATTYTCAWPTAGAHTIRFGGTATGYSTGTTTAAISFFEYGGTQAKVAGVSGSLGAMFPFVNGNIPGFRSAFSGTQITSIPAGLFSGIDTSSATNTSFVFYSTFANTKITSIPAGLFSGIDTSKSTDTSYMFYSTFYNCTDLTQIPAGLFNSIDTSKSTITFSMFSGTFSDTQITSIPARLFDKIDTSSATNTSSMFHSTFANTKITSIPAGLFSGIDTSKSTDTSYMFYYTFYNCTNLTGYIPPTAFPKTIKPGTSSSSGMWDYTFSGTNLATVCPAGTGEYDSGFQNDWGRIGSNTTTDGTYRVSCEPCTGTLPEHATYTTGTCNWTCNSGYLLNNDVCVECSGAIYNGRCRELCPVGRALFHAGEYTYPVFADKTDVPSPVLHIRRDENTVCYVYLEPDAGGEHGLKLRFTDNKVYHAIDPR